jgi:hypothetical protein
MQKTLWPSPINDEMNAIENEIHDCLDNDSPIDTVKLKRLCALSVEHLTELVKTHDQRLEVMKAETRKMTEKLLGLDLDFKPELKQKILEEQDKFDKVASLWVNSETTLWGESQAASIAAGILILANQIQ